MGQTYTKSSQVPQLKVEDFQDPFLTKFLDSVMDQKKEYPLPVPIVSLIHGEAKIPLLTLKSFSLWQGKQKSKKTTLLALMISAFITELTSRDYTRFEGVKDGVVLIFDNEQGESYAARTMKLILKLAGLETTERMKYCDLRQHTPADRFKIIEAGIQGTPNVKLVIIDGIVDLMTDFMDSGEGHMAITNLIKYCSEYDIHVAGVLHQNKGDNNARAHVGTISSQKCELEISTEVDKDDRSKSLVSCINSRGLPFEQFAIRWEKGQLPCIDQDFIPRASKEKKQQEKADVETSVLRELAEKLFPQSRTFKRVEMLDLIGEELNTSESTQIRRFKQMLNDKVIIKHWSGGYQLAEKGSRGHEGSTRGQ